MESEAKQMTSHIRVFSCLGVSLCVIIAANIKVELFASSKTGLRQIGRRKTWKHKQFYYYYYY